jgi:hypothetical protein
VKIDELELNALIFAQDSAVIQMLLEACLDRSDSSSGILIFCSV